MVLGDQVLGSVNGGPVIVLCGKRRCCVAGGYTTCSTLPSHIWQSDRKHSRNIRRTFLSNREPAFVKKKLKKRSLSPTDEKTFENTSLVN